MFFGRQPAPRRMRLRSCSMRDRVAPTTELWPDEFQVDWDGLERATTEEPFLESSFELLRETGVLLTLAASASTDERPENGRNEGIVLGHLVRMANHVRDETAPILGVVDDCGLVPQGMEFRNVLVQKRSDTCASSRSVTL